MKTIKGNQENAPKNAAAPDARAAEDASSVLRVTMREGVSEERQFADLATDGIASNAMTARYFANGSQPGLSITEMVDSLKDHGQRVNANDLNALEQMLTAQAVSLNAIYGECARRAALNIGQYLDASERYLRLALKAQAQSRATVEALAVMKNPPVVYAKQANIANGPQQVNNGIPPPTMGPGATPATNSQSQPTKLLEGAQHGGTGLDAGTTAAATRGHPTLETVAAVNRAEDASGKGAGKAQ